MAKHRIPMSVLAALGLAAPKCDPEPPIMPCLSVVSDSAEDRNRRADAAAVPVIGPCLSPVDDTGMLQPCLEIAPDPRTVRPEPHLSVCLSPVPPPQPEMTVCLSIEVDPPSDGDKRSDSRKSAGEDLLDRGILPPDVVDALRKRKTTES